MINTPKPFDNKFIIQKNRAISKNNLLLPFVLTFEILYRD